MNLSAVSARILRPGLNDEKKKVIKLLFCHGLGSAKRDIIANKIQQWANVQGVLLNDLNYKNYGQEDYIWDINSWKTDVMNELKRYDSPIKLNNERHESMANTIIVCYSAASQAVLRALLALKNQSTNTKSEPAGILMISPGIGMNVESYVERLMPGSINKLKAGNILIHPSSDPTNCPTRNEINMCFPIKCPVRIVHGIHDKLVPYKNSINLLDRLETKNKALYLINDGHFVQDQQIINYALDNLWETVTKE